MSNIFELVAKLKFNSKEYEDGLKDAQAKGNSFSSKMATAGKVAVAGIAAVSTAVVGVSTAMAKGLKDTADYGDVIDKTSQKLGVSTEAYQKWDYVMNLAGTSMQNMGTGLKTLTNKLDDAKNGGEASIEMFNKLGLSVEQLDTMSREDIFNAAIAGFQGMADSTERAALANDLFGKSGQELTPLFNMTADETAKLMNNLEAMGGVMSEDAVKASADFEDALTTLQAGLSGAKNGLVSDFLPAATTAIEGFTALVTGDDSGLGQINNGLDQFITNLTDSLPRILEVGGSIAEGLASAIIDNLPKIFEAGSGIVMTLSEKIILALPQLVQTGLQIIVTLADSIGQSLPTLIPTIVDVILQITETLIDNVDLLIDGAIALIIGLADGLITNLPKLIERIPELIIKVVEALIRNAPKLLEAALELILTLANGLTTYLPRLITEIPKMVLKIYNAFVAQKDKLKEAGKNFVTGLWEGFKENWANFINNVVGQAKELISKVQAVFKISSPSKVFKQIGAYCVEGFADGSDGMFSSEGMNAKITADVTGRTDTTDAVIELLNQYLPTIASGNQIVLDTGALVGSTASLYNAELGRIAARGAYV